MSRISVRRQKWVGLWSCVLLHLLALAGPTTAALAAEAEEPYRIQPGDVLSLSVWGEENLTQDVLVRPDGGLNFPLAGEQQAAGRTIEELRATIEDKLRRFVPKPTLTIALRQIGGNRIYVIGKVNRPGEFMFTRPLDVLQALSLAGGTNPFAAVDNILILRRENGSHVAIPFRYGDVARGQNLETIVLLRSGDTVVVP